MRLRLRLSGGPDRLEIRDKTGHLLTQIRVKFCHGEGEMEIDIPELKEEPVVQAVEGRLKLHEVKVI